MNVTEGAIRAVYLKHAECPVVPDDIEGDQCTGLCHMSWRAHAPAASHHPPPFPRLIPAAYPPSSSVLGMPRTTASAAR